MIGLRLVPFTWVKRFLGGCEWGWGQALRFMPNYLCSTPNLRETFCGVIDRYRAWDIGVGRKTVHEIDVFELKVSPSTLKLVWIPKRDLPFFVFRFPRRRAFWRKLDCLWVFWSTPSKTWVICLWSNVQPSSDVASAGLINNIWFHWDKRAFINDVRHIGRDIGSFSMKS